MLCAIASSMPVKLVHCFGVSSFPEDSSDLLVLAVTVSLDRQRCVSAWMDFKGWIAPSVLDARKLNLSLKF